MSGESYESPADVAMKNLVSMAGRMTAGLAEATRTPVWEYRIVGWDEVNRLAREGWEMRAADIALLRFLMCRKLGPADEAERLLTS